MYCGLDFGTSNSLCATEDAKGQPAFVQLEAGQQDLPSAVFYPKGEEEPQYGRQALDLYITGAGGRLLRSFKRLLGTKYFGAGTMLNSSRKLSFQSLFVSFLQHIKSQAETQLQTELTQVVFGRPVRFSHQALHDKAGKQDLAKVASLIGFEQVEFQYEPIAAAFAHEQRLRKEMLAIVIDIGGGTSDFSILRLGPTRKNLPDRSADILANTGATIGGTDFDGLLSLTQVMTYFGYGSTFGEKNLDIPVWPYRSASDWNRIALELYLPKTYRSISEVERMARERDKVKRFLRLIEDKRAHHLLKEVEAAKIGLSQNEQALISPDFIEEGLDISLQRTPFEEVMQSKIRDMQVVADEALSDAGISHAQIELIILTGGSSAMPIIQAAFMERFPQAQLSDENRLGSVCAGLLYDARRKFA